MLFIALAASGPAYADGTAAPAIYPGGTVDAGASVFRVLGALILVLGLFFGAIWLLKNWQRFAQKNGSKARLNLIEVKSLGQRQTLYVIGYESQRLLLAATPAGVTLVSHLPDAEAELAATATQPAPKLSFAEAFQQVLGRKA